ncbi:MAG: hypothetical protein J0H98_11275 [Solirubrobacterales bacterium]|nr:hypothetical protein [Solirubrobacterales bacterium]
MAEGFREGDVVIVGGYGHVGLAIARHLAPLHPGRVVLSGRNQGKAAAAAGRIGHGCRGIALDTAEGLAPREADAVIMCLDQFDPSFASDCLGHGLGYVDVSADGRILEMVEALDPAAHRSGARGLIDVGLAPGLTNLLARLLVETGGPVEKLDLFVLLGVGDDHGRAALEWTLDKFDSEFIVFEDGRPQWVRAQRESNTVRVPGRRLPVFGVRFDFPEQRSLVRTLGVPTVSSWMATLPPSAARSMRLAALAGGGELTRRPRSRRVLLSALERGSVGTDRCGVLVRATAADGKATEASVLSHDQSGLTAAATSLMAAEVIEGRTPVGVHHSDQVIEPGPLLARLAEIAPDAVIDVPGGTTIPA